MMVRVLFPEETVVLTLTVPLDEGFDVNLIRTVLIYPPLSRQPLLKKCKTTDKIAMHTHMQVALAIYFGVPGGEHHLYFITSFAIAQHIACPILFYFCPSDIIAIL